MKNIILSFTLVIATLLAVKSFAEKNEAKELQGHAIHTGVDEISSVQYQQAIDKMQNTYTMLTQVLDSNGKSKLAASQAAWLTYSQADCRFTTDYAHGDVLEKAIYQNCLANMTDDRTFALNYQLRQNLFLNPSLAINNSKN